METRSCGNSELRLSVLGTGCWAFGGGDYWGDQSQKDVNEVVRRSVELGINYFDTAEAYNNGRSEKSLGQAVRGIDREKIIIGTKVSPSNCYRETLIRHCEASLGRLGTEYIDLYMIHWPVHPHSIRHFTKDESVVNNPPSVSDIVEALVQLQSQGKIRFAGVSNFAKEGLSQIMGAGLDVVVNQLPYSLLTRAVEYEILPWCQQKGIGVIGYMTLLQGLLADIYPTLSYVPRWQRRTRHFNCSGCELCRHGEEGAEEETGRALVDIRSIAQDCGMTMPEMAVQWAVANNAITCALVGARNVGELEANAKAVSDPLAKELTERLNIATNAVKEKLGPSFDYYESTANDRTR
jgi:aryl-alcohol dehydrogenase-like predicted oxidoreductase